MNFFTHKRILLLDNIFSQNVRLRQTDDYGNGICCYCGKVVNYKEADNCHYILRKNMSLRINEFNCNIGHHECNIKDTNTKQHNKYKNFLIKKYGSEKVEELEQIARGIHELWRNEIEEKIKYYRSWNKKIAKDKMFQVNLY